MIRKIFASSLSKYDFRLKNVSCGFSFLKYFPVLFNYVLNRWISGVVGCDAVKCINRGCSVDG